MTFEEAMKAAGLLPLLIVPDGKWRRCRTVDKSNSHRNGAYILYPDGRGYFRNWALDSEVNSWRDDQATIATPMDLARIEAQRAQQREKRIRAVRAAREFWAKSTRLVGGHPYLNRKGLSMVGCTNLRTSGESLVIPVMAGEKIISLQTIEPDGSKRFFAGAPVKSGAYLITRPRAAVTCLCEGLATGLALFQSIQQSNVIVCFDAGNLLPVAERIKPTGSVVVCGDNDHATQAKRGFNPGLEKANNVAEYLGCGMAAPHGFLGSDWADVLREHPAGAKYIAREVLKYARYI